MPDTRDVHTTLRRALLIDAVATGTVGALLLVAPSMLEGALGLPQELLRGAGLVLVPFAALLAYLALRPSVSTRVMWGIIGANALWAVDSVILLASGWVEPGALGVAFVLAQGAVVAVFAYLEYIGLRRVRALQTD